MLCRRHKTCQTLPAQQRLITELKAPRQPGDPAAQAYRARIRERCVSGPGRPKSVVERGFAGDPEMISPLTRRSGSSLRRAT